MSSLSWSQRGHRSGCCSPHLAKRSAVQQRLQIAIQMNIFTLSGDQVFQRRRCGSNRMPPMKYLSYADLVENWPDGLGVQMCRSLCPTVNGSCSTTSMNCSTWCIAITGTPPTMSSVHELSMRACCTMRLFHPRLRTNGMTAGMSSATDFPCTHRSTQKAVLAPSPTETVVEIMNNADI